MTTMDEVGSSSWLGEGLRRRGGGSTRLAARRSARTAEVVVTPGQPRHPRRRSPRRRRSIDADLFVIGPEAPLVDGLADRLRAAGRLVFGPGADGARLEGSKAWMKEVLAEAGVPTARYGAFTDVEPALAFLRTLPGPCVVKTDGLAAGKGVLVTESLDEAAADVRAKLVRRGLRRRRPAGGDRGGPDRARAVAAVRLRRQRAVPLAPAQDFKRLGDGDAGPNTGGMGAYSPVPVAGDGRGRRGAGAGGRAHAGRAAAPGHRLPGRALRRPDAHRPTAPRCSSTTSASATPRPRSCCPATPATWPSCWPRPPPAACEREPAFVDRRRGHRRPGHRGLPGRAPHRRRHRGPRRGRRPCDGVTVFRAGVGPRRRRPAGHRRRPGARVTGLGADLAAARDAGPTTAVARISWPGHAVPHRHRRRRRVARRGSSPMKVAVLMGSASDERQDGAGGRRRSSEFGIEADERVHVGPPHAGRGGRVRRAAPARTATRPSSAGPAWPPTWPARWRPTPPCRSSACPCRGGALNGVDALYATVQMPQGIPVATVAIDGAMNAALLVVQMLAITDAGLAQQLDERRRPTLIPDVLASRYCARPRWSACSPDEARAPAVARGRGAGHRGVGTLGVVPAGDVEAVRDGPRGRRRLRPGRRRAGSGSPTTTWPPASRSSRRPRPPASTSTTA